MSVTPEHLRRRRADILRETASRVGITGTAYDTAWLASVPEPRERRGTRFPGALEWLVENQHADGSWGGEVRYEHDRLLSTLAALPALAQFGRRARDRAAVAMGTRYLWQHAHRLSGELEALVGFELLLPALVQRARAAGISVPSNLQAAYQAERTEKLRLIPPSALYSPRTTVAHSIEFLGDTAVVDGLSSVQGPNGSLGNSPAATAFYLSLTNDARAEAYLSHCQDWSGGATVPVLHPCETFELLWAAYHLSLGGLPTHALLAPDERARLRTALHSGGVSLSATFPIPDADDTAVALLLLHDLGEPVDARCLQAFALPDGHFASFPHERHPSIGVNLHVLHALVHVPGYPDQAATVRKLVDYVCDQQDAPYWTDKWHISPYYATAHAIRVLADLPPGLAHRVSSRIDGSLEWLRQTQNADGSWGFYGVGTAEETAYALLGLAPRPGRELAPDDRARCAAGRRYLRNVLGGSTTSIHHAFPALWIDKCLYTPALVVRAAIEAAFQATHHRRLSTSVRTAAPREENSLVA